MDIILIRHGMTFANEAKSFSTMDTKLSPAGWEGLDQTKENLKKYAFSKIYISEMHRTYETLCALGLEDENYQKEPRLNEYDFGIFKGMPREEMLRDYQDMITAWGEDIINYRVPEGENVPDLMVRVRDFYEQLLDQGENSLIITHDGVIRAFLCIVFDTTEVYSKVKSTNGGITVIQIEDEIAKLLRYNEY
ncbi:MAG: histidine phosphatase family protein [Tissierellia bacterium]|nr:histidine phosphatase family protein [Tissierellia bacterium]